TAVANASWTASSASSKSPRMRMRIESARPHSSGRGVRPLLLHERPYLHRSLVDDRNALGELDRLVGVLALGEEVTAAHLLRLGERAVRDDRLAVPHAHGRRGPRGGQLSAADDLLSRRFAEGAVARVHGLALVVAGPFPGLLVRIDQRHHLHVGPPSVAVD